MSIRTRLILLIAFLVVVVLVMVFVAGTEVNRLSTLSESITGRAMQRIEYMSQINTNIMQWRGLNLSIILIEDPQTRQIYQSQLSRIKTDTQNMVQQYSNIITDPIRRADYEAFLTHVQEYTEIDNNLDILLSIGKGREAAELFSSSQNAFDEMYYHINRIKIDEINNTRDASLQATATATDTRNFFTWLTVAGIVSLIGLGFYIWYSLSSGLRRLIIATRQVSSGDLSQPIPTISKDEIGELVQSFNTMVLSVKQSQEENQRLTQEALKLKEERIGLLQQQFFTTIKAQEEERKRIARELHDDTAQSLVTLSRGLDSILSQKKELTAGSTKELEQMRQTVDLSLQNVRRFSQDLRPSIIDDLGLVPAIEWLSTRLGKLQPINALIKTRGAIRRLSPEIELTLFRIAQEALTNVSKHSKATSVDISIIFEKHKVMLSISDNGQGFVVPVSWNEVAIRSQLGLLGMRERAQLIQGNLEIDSKPGTGTVIRIEVPIDQQTTLEQKT